jgi:hypothetical protein
MHTYPYKEILNKAAIQGLATKFQDTESVCNKCSLSDKTAEIIAVPIPSSACDAARIQYLIGFVVLCMKGFM